MKKTFFAIVAVIALALGLVACQSTDKAEPASDGADQLAALKEAGTMKVGMCPEYPPFESINDDGEIEGFDVDLANAIGEKLGLKVEFVNTPYEGLIAGLQSGDFDLIMSGMSPSEAENADKSLNITESYYAVDEVIMTKDDAIKSKDDLKGKKVGSHSGSTSEYAVEDLKKAGIELESMTYNRNSEAFADLQNGNIDAQVVEDTWAKEKSKGTDIRILDEPISSVEMAGIMPKNGQSFKEAYNKALQELKDSGEYEKIVAKWF